MTRSGSSVHRDIKSKISDLERQHSAYSSKISGSEGKIDAINDEREGILARLAAIYMPEAEANDLTGKIKEAQAEVKAIFKEKQDRRKKLDDLVATTLESVERMEGKLDDMASNLNSMNKEKASLEKEARAQLDQTEGYKEAIVRAKQTQSEFEQGKRRLEVFEADAKAKLAEYDSNPLFSYLLRRNFNLETAGTLDRWVARLVDYTGQRQKYDFLKEMPKLLEKEVGKRKAEYEKADSIVDRMEEDVAKKVGLTAVLKRISDAVEQRNNLIARQEAGNSDVAKYRQEIKEIDSGKSEYQNRAVSTLKGYLEDYSVQELKRQAQATPGSEDDKLVAKIEAGEESKASLKEDIKKYKAEQGDVADVLKGLKEIESIFRRRDYEADRSRFSSSFDVNAILEKFMRGQLSVGQFDELMKRSHDWEPKPDPTPVYRSTYHSSSPSSRSTFGGSFGGGGSSSFGGGFSGGGRGV